MIRRQQLKYTTAANGAATTIGNAVLGTLYAVLYQPGDTDTGATVTVTCEGTGTKPLLTKATAGTANLWLYPRDLVHAVLDGAALTGTSGGDRAEPVLEGNLKVVIASGGDTKSGSVICYYHE